jgi:hypothetical protein
MPATNKAFTTEDTESTEEYPIVFFSDLRVLGNCSCVALPPASVQSSVVRLFSFILVAGMARSYIQSLLCLSKCHLSLTFIVPGANDEARHVKLYCFNYKVLLANPGYLIDRIAQTPMRE